MQKGDLKMIDFLEIVLCLFNRVKYYCAICHPNVDKLTQAQLNRMVKCRHSII